MDIPIEIINKILLYRPPSEVHKTMSKCIQTYKYWSEKRKRGGGFSVSFVTYCFEYFLNPISFGFRRKNVIRKIDINDVYEWMVEVYRPDIDYSLDKVREDMLKTNLNKLFWTEHKGFNIKISNEKLNKYIEHGKKKLIKNYF
jgi:hypothetical protein